MLGLESRHSDTHGQAIPGLFRAHFTNVFLQPAKNRAPVLVSSVQRQHSKFIPADTGKNVRVTERSFQCIRRANKSKVSFSVTKAVVDIFEMIDVGKEKKQSMS